MRRICFLSILFLFSCGSGAVKVKPVYKPITESVYASGVVKARNQYQVYSTVSGTVDSIYAEVGDTVIAGQVIMLLSSAVQRISRDNAELAAALADYNVNKDKLNDALQSLDVASNRLRNDSLAYYRQKKLWSQQVGTLSDLEQKEFVYNNAVASVKAARTKYDDLNRQLRYNAAQSKNNVKMTGTIENDYIIKSRINGVLYSLNKEKGELVTPQSPLAEIGDIEDYILEIQIDEYDILKIKPGMKVFVTFDSYRDSVFEARISKLNPLMNEGSKSFTVEAEFIQKPDLLFPNTSLEASILIQSKDRALLIPRTLLINDNKVINSNGDTINIITGLKDYKMVEVLSGISIDDELLSPLK